MDEGKIKVVELSLENDNKRINYSFAKNYVHDTVTNITELKKLFETSDSEFLFLIKNNMIPVKDIKSIVDKSLDYDLLWLNKIKDDCRYFYKIDDDLRKATTPNSCQAIILSKKVYHKLRTEIFKTEKEFISILNSYTLHNRFKTAVTSNNLFYFDMNSVSSLSDINKLVECDPYKSKEINYSSIVCIMLFVFIIVCTVLLVFL